MKRELTTFAAFLAIFLFAYFVPLGDPTVRNAIYEAFNMLQWYARNHTLACVIPALFIAGAITTFLRREAVLKHLGPKANKAEAYGVASVAGTVLAVCSCSVLPMFAGIYRVGAGLGPAACFLYAGPAINVLAIFLTARVLGFELGVARVIGAVVFGVIIGLIMALLFRRSEAAREQQLPALPDAEPFSRPIWKNALFLAAMVAFLVFSDWFNPGDKVVALTNGRQFDAVLRYETRDAYTLQLKDKLPPLAIDAFAASAKTSGDLIVIPKAVIQAIDDAPGWVVTIHHYRWHFAGLMGLAVAIMAWNWYDLVELREWMANTWSFAKLLIPLLFGGVFAVGFLGALLPEAQVAALVGDNGVLSNLIASVIGMLFYFATLTEVPILEALMKHGMASGPALALLLAGPALSIPSILVIRSIIGNFKTIVFCVLVIVMATVSGMVFGTLYPQNPMVPLTQHEAITTGGAGCQPDVHAATKLSLIENLQERRISMKTVQVLGTGCAKCAHLKEVAEAAVDELGAEAKVEKIEDINQIAAYGVFMTPALAIDGTVKVQGRVPRVEEIKAMLE